MDENEPTWLYVCVVIELSPPPRSLSDTGYYYYIYFFIWFFFPFFTMIIGFPVDTQLFFFSFHLFYGRTKQGWADFFFVQRWFMFTTWHQRLCVISHMQCWFRFFGEKSLSHNPSTHELNLRLMNWQLDVKNWIGKIFKILKFWIFINLIVLIFMSVCYRADRRQRWLRVEVTPISTPMEMMLL